jgi:hypothetical protein
MTVVVNKTYWLKLSGVPGTLRLPQDYAAAVLAYAKTQGDYITDLRVVWEQRQVWLCKYCKSRPGRGGGFTLSCTSQQCIDGGEWARSNQRIKV